MNFGRRAPLVAAAALATGVAWLVMLYRYRGWVAHDDFAVLRIDLERQLGGHIRLVGAYSRLDLFHPGPLHEWVLAGPYALSGRRAAALPATALVLNAWWFVWIVAVARRMAARPETVAALAGAAVVVVALGDELASPWNPSLSVLPAYLSVVALAAMACRAAAGESNTWQAWMPAVVGASFAAQSHASMLVVSATVLAGVVGLCGLAGGRAATWRGAVGPMAVTAALCSGPLLDVVRHGRHANLIRLVTAEPDGTRVGLGLAWRRVARVMLPQSWWTGEATGPGGPGVGTGPVWVPALVVLVAVGAGWVTRRRGRVPVLAIVAAVLLAAATVSVALFVEPPFAHLYSSVQAVVVAVVVLALAAITGTAAGTAADTGEQREAASPYKDLVGIATIAAAVVLAFGFVTAARTNPTIAARQALGIDAAVGRYVDGAGWTTVAVVALDLQIDIADADIAAAAVRRGLVVHVDRPEFGLASIDGTEPVLVAAMGAARECVLVRPDATVLADGRSAGTGALLMVAAFDSVAAVAPCR